MAISGAISAEYLGLFNRSNEGNPSNHVFGVEFDDYRNEEFDDVSDNHVGVDLNSLASWDSQPAGFWENGEKLEKLVLDNGQNYQVWIEYLNSELNVTMAPAGRRKPEKPLISRHIDLSGVLLDEMYVGFSGATGKMVDICRILAWSFSTSNFSIGDALITKNLPSYVNKPKGLEKFILSAIISALFITFCLTLVLLTLFKTEREAKGEEKTEDWELEYWPHRISYQEIRAATRDFCEGNVIGKGTSGKVYKGVLQGEEVAVKRIPRDTQHGMREFVAEISSLGRMKHKNLVGFRGWCKRTRGNLILVYDYMPNGSLDKRVFECDDERKILTWEERIRVLQNVASGISYLHDGWEVAVLHRDIKAENVLLDKDMNARLGDFGLARLHHHENLADATRVMGTLGYMEPELVRIGRSSTKTDVYSFGVLVLEVVCGRRPIVADQPSLTDHVLSLMESGKLCCAIDEHLKGKGGYTVEEVERVLRLGLLCVSSDPRDRPSMREVVKMLEGIKGCEGNEEQCVDVSLLEKIKSAAMWSRSDSSSTDATYPSFEDILPLKLFTTASLSGSCALLDSNSNSEKN